MQRMNFGSKWLCWMEALVFKSLMSILVNGTTTSEFRVKRGLIKGDPLSPYIFLLVGEGLEKLVKNATNLGNFQCYHFNEDIHFALLRFADDAILISGGSWNNLWILK